MVGGLFRSYFLGDKQPSFLDSFNESAAYDLEFFEDKITDLKSTIRDMTVFAETTPISPRVAYFAIEALCLNPPIDKDCQDRFFKELYDRKFLDDPKFANANYYILKNTTKFSNISKHNALMYLCSLAVEQNKEDLAVQIINLFSERACTGLYQGKSLYILSLEKNFGKLTAALLNKLPEEVSLLWAFIGNTILQDQIVDDITGYFLERLNNELKEILKSEDLDLRKRFINCLPSADLFIHTACQFGDIDAITGILRITPCVNCKDKQGHSPFYYIGERKDLTLLYQFIEKVKRLSNPNASNLLEESEEVAKLFPEAAKKITKKISKLPSHLLANSFEKI